MLVIIIYLVVTVKSQEEIYITSFKKNVVFVSKIIAESLKNASILQDLSSIKKSLDLITSEKNGDIIYVIILTPDNKLMESSFESTNMADIKELEDTFKVDVNKLNTTSKDNKVEPVEKKDPFIRKKLNEDSITLTQEVDKLREKYIELRLVSSNLDAKEKIKSFLQEQQELEVDIAKLEEDLSKAETEDNKSEVENINTQITEKQKKLDSIQEIIVPLTHMGLLYEKIEKIKTLISKLESNNLIYEFSQPMTGKDGENYGTVIIGFSPKSANETIKMIYIESIVTGIIYVIIGLFISLFLAKLITKPVEELATGAEILGSGNLYYRINLKTGDEMEILANSLNNMAEKLNESYSSLEQRVKERTREYLDVTIELRKTLVKLKETQSQLVQSEKMTSLGQLVAGVAHELNNPIGFIYSNMGPLDESIQTMTDIVELYKTFNLNDEDKQKLEKFIKDNDFEFMLEDLEFLIKDIREGAERSQKIVSDLKNFSRLDEADYKEVDIHQGINSTLNLLVNQYKHKVTIHKEYGSIPLISCYASQLNQVWMNLLVNASQAIQDKGDVWVNTSFEDEIVTVKIKDTGGGIPKDVLEKIFDPFFTTKPVGQGTGLGLSITHSIIKKHDGTIDVESEEGVGTTFIIKLPTQKSVKIEDDEDMSLDTDIIDDYKSYTEE